MRVAIHYDEHGNPTVYADEGVEVYSVCDYTPSDRLYLMSPAPIPRGLLDGPVGFAGDGSAAEGRAVMAVRMMPDDEPEDEPTLQ